MVIAIAGHFNSKMSSYDYMFNNFMSTCNFFIKINLLDKLY